MNFTYDNTDDTLYIHLSDSAVVLRQQCGSVTVTINEKGAVLGLDIPNPGADPWPVKELLYQYPLTIDQSFFIVTLAERYLLFRF